MNYTKTEKKELLNEWFNLLGFDVLNKVFDINLFRYSDNYLDKKLNEIDKCWSKFSLFEKENVFINHYDKSLQYVSDSKYDSLFDEIYNS